ncbi:MAG: hypothetical protein OEZ20_01230 [candidate division WOR-3 bacterium]|nr:hypothetical protein [candidate division WOR-3 bacterium]MDH5683079.1 hypothetical protein [candidate division WOR-3 bacterium]
MATNNKRVVEVPTKDFKRILKAYNTIGSFLEHYLGPELLYKKEFIKGMRHALNEVVRKKTKRVNDWESFRS